MLFIIVGIIAAFNWIIIIKKIQMERYMDATLDVGFMVAFVWLFGDTGQGGMIVSMIGSAVVSVVLFKTPLNFAALDSEEEEESEVDKLFSTGAPNGNT